MGLLQSLKLSGASKNLRRLFRRSKRSTAGAGAGAGVGADAVARSDSPSQHGDDAEGANDSKLQGTANSGATPTSQRQVIDRETGSSNNNIDDKSNTPASQPGSSEAMTSSGAYIPDVEDALVADKENQAPNIEGLKDSLAQVKLSDEIPTSTPELTQRTDQDLRESNDPLVQAEKARHQHFTDEALSMARLALRTNETPVGCVLVYRDNIIAKGMNATNITRNGTRHAEFMAISALLSYAREDGPKTTRLGQPLGPSGDDESEKSVDSEGSDGNDDGSKGHLYPYGQKLHPDRIVDQDILHECILYVTVEPCVMCASLLRQFGIKKVYFGAVNDKFGGTGGVFSIHANSLPDTSATKGKLTSRPAPSLIGAAGTLGESFPVGGGDGGNVEPGYEIEGGWGRDEAVGLLRRFYVQENGRAPVPRKKEGRAARLAAMMDSDGPDAVCAALLLADGVASSDKPLSTNGVTEIAESNKLPTQNSPCVPAHTAHTRHQYDSDSDKENVPEMA